MKNIYFSHIIKNFLRNRYSKETEEKVQRWIIDEKDDIEKETEIHEFWQSLDFEPDDSVYKSLETVKERLNIGSSKRKKLNFLRVFKVAAIVIPLVLLGGYSVYLMKFGENMITVSVPYNEREELILPDQSNVWINAGSTLKYPKSFLDKSRVVHLTGEAFFSVEQDISRPFIVRTDNIEIQVLGTRFNVSAYSEDYLLTVFVKEGKVRVKMPDDIDCDLVASQQIKYDKLTAEYVVETLSTKDTPIWIDGSFIFEKKTLNEIISVLERSYDKTFEVDEILLNDKNLYTIKFLNNETIEQILNLLSDMIGFSFTIDGHNVKLNKEI